MLKTILVCAVPILLVLYIANAAAHKLNDVANAVASAQFERNR
jgi:hypothetical protein